MLREFLQRKVQGCKIPVFLSHKVFESIGNGIGPFFAVFTELNGQLIVDLNIGSIEITCAESQSISGLALRKRNILNRKISVSGAKHQIRTTGTFIGTSVADTGKITANINPFTGISYGRRAFTGLIPAIV